MLNKRIRTRIGCNYQLCLFHMNRAASKLTGPVDNLLHDTSLTEPDSSWFSPLRCFCFNLNDSWLMWGVTHVSDCNIYLCGVFFYLFDDCNFYCHKFVLLLWTVFLFYKLCSTVFFYELQLMTLFLASTRPHIRTWQLKEQFIIITMVASILDLILK